MLAIATWEANGLISLANDAFLELAGYSRQDLKEGGIAYAIDITERKKAEETHS